MIVRVWKACAAPERAQAYREHLQTAVFPVLRSLEGFVGAELLERTMDDEVEFQVETRWTSIRAVRAFAGDAVEKAVVAPEARAVLASFDEEVSHYNVVAECRP